MCLPFLTVFDREKGIVSCLTSHVHSSSCEFLMARQIQSLKVIVPLADI